jgi:hypothetical protein
MLHGEWDKFKEGVFEQAAQQIDDDLRTYK